MEKNPILFEIIKRAQNSVSHELGQLHKLSDRTGASVQRRRLLKIRERINQFAEQA